MSEQAGFIRIAGFCRKPFIKEDGELCEGKTLVVSFEIGLKPGALSFEVGMRNTTDDGAYTSELIGQFRQEIDGRSSSDTESWHGTSHGRSRSCTPLRIPSPTASNSTPLNLRSAPGDSGDGDHENSGVLGFKDKAPPPNRSAKFYFPGMVEQGF